MRLYGFADFLALVTDADATLVALDVRGTLLRAPRGGHLTRAFTGSGLGAATLAAMDAEVPASVLERYPRSTSVVDWTLVTILEAGRFAAERGEPLDSVVLERAFQRLNAEYRTRSVPLVEDAALLETVRALNRSGVEVILSADGPAQRERDVLRAVFPRTAAYGLEVFSSEEAGTNKLGDAFFARLAEHRRLPPARIVVVGDRLDKDVFPALAAGCAAVLIGETDRPVPQAPGFRDIAAAAPEREGSGLVLGRFQPLHREHVRYLDAALDRVEHLVVGVTHPFDAVPEAGGGPRNDPSANPLPFWLRERILLDWADRNRVASRVTVRPVPLTGESLRSVVAPGTVVLVTEVEPWSLEKRAVIESAGHRVVVLDVGDKTVSGTEVRDLIRRGDPGWRRFVPDLADELLDEIVACVSAAP
jgi:FMN phosphatase YigB (HAD superfamily)/nicotinamide mononucleotide adenylyltransferase